MKYYLFLKNGNIVWTTSADDRSEMINNNYQYMGCIEEGVSQGINIHPYKGSNKNLG